mmetsp:Transcript_164298/g.522507  ORF Transcript_164298/g.522507 Transcript_164298/m.522507 type:complete len:918 (+) Transcript_164298:149-2902(+)
MAVSQDHIRNICILAHVDHGKTTCADNLVASNGFISRQSAGKIRYMDSRMDEQERQITMKSSSIALQWRNSTAEESPTYIVNLIDSPGHVDFTSEVSMAARLADGALVVVDVVEGVAAQTRTVLRQAWRDRVRTCLLLNKVDRLIIELELTPLEAYERLLKILEQVNAVNQQLVCEEVMARDAEATMRQGAAESAAAGEGIDLAAPELQFDLAAEEAVTYSPERGNVAFGSASHGWAFCLDGFARLIAGKMGAKPANLQRVLWGEFSFNKKTKRAQFRSPTDTKSKPMFVEFVLQQIFAVYEASYRSLNLELLSKMQSQIAGWKDIDLNRLTTGSAAVRELMSRWQPFAECILQMAAQHLPSPREAAANRLPVLCPRWFAAGDRIERGPIMDALRDTDPAGPTVVYLAKFLAADLVRCVLTGDTLVGDEDVKFVGLCRVFSGTLRPETQLFIMREEEEEEEETKDAKVHRALFIERIFVMKGRFMEAVQEAPAGSIVSVQVRPVDGEGGRAHEMGVERCLTLCDSEEGPFLETPYSSQAFAMVRVSIEPKNVADLDALDRGLRLLHKADPSVSIEVMVTGENVLGCCGDEHLKRCITDLQKLFARGVPLSISKPLVAVREAIAPSVSADRVDPKSSTLWLPSWASHLVDSSTEAGSVHSAPVSDHNENDSDAGMQQQHQQDRISMSSSGVMSVWTANRKVCLRVSAVALPQEVLKWMDEFAEDLESVVHRQRASMAFAAGRTVVTVDECLEEVASQFQKRLEESSIGSCAVAGASLCGMSVARGCRTVLLDASSCAWTLRDSHHLGSGGFNSSAAERSKEAAPPEDRVHRSLWPSVLTGFQLASASGPLCEEPMRGVAFVLHSCHQVVGSDEQQGNQGAGAEGVVGHGRHEGSLLRQHLPARLRPHLRGHAPPGGEL